MTVTEAQHHIVSFKENVNYDRNTFLWGPEEGDPIIIKNLTDIHLCNIINWIIDDVNDVYTSSLLKFMIGEASHRRLEAFAEGRAYVIMADDHRAAMVYP